MTDLEPPSRPDDESDPEPAGEPSSLDELEARMCQLAGRIAATECEFLTLLAEYDAREGWAVWELRSAAHWLSQRCGMRLGAARERVRVARALTLLPRVRAAFAAGRLSYCKVRALTRVATPTTEETLVELAFGATGAQLERIVRSWRTVLTEDLAATQHVRRSVKRREHDDGSVVFVLRLPREEAAVLDAALRAARAEVGDGDGLPVETPEEARLAEELSRDEPRLRTEADALVLMAERFLANPTLPVKPELFQVVIHARADMFDASAPAPPGPGIPDSHVQSGQSIVERASQVGPAGASIEAGDGQVCGAAVARLLCEASTQVWTRDKSGRTLDIGRTKRNATRNQRRALFLRDRGCRFPGCTRRSHLIPHHVQWWSRRGRTDMDNLVLLCGAHHRAVHEIGYAVTALGHGRFTFVRPDGRQLLEPGDDTAQAAADERAEWSYVDPRSVVPTWGGERLDLRMLISAMATNVLIEGGYSVAATPSRDLPAAVRAAAEWPLEVKRRRDEQRQAA